MKKKILITGGFGFLGTNLILKLIKNKSFDIYILSKTLKKKFKNKKNLKIIQLDIAKKKKYFKFNQDFDYVINLAGNIDHKNKSQTFKAHYIGVKNLLKFINLKELKLLIQIGSSLEYGRINSPHKESFKCKPISHYGKAKFFASEFVKKKLKKYLILRPYQIYGPYQKKDRLIPMIIDGCLKDKTFACSEGLQLRDFLFVDDFSELIKKIIQTKKISYGVFNVGYGKPHKVKNTINLIQKKIKKGNPLFGKIKMRKEEMKCTYPDIQKIKKKYSWKPKTNINLGLRKTINFYANQ